MIENSSNRIAPFAFLFSTLLACNQIYTLKSDKIKSCLVSALDMHE